MRHESEPSYHWFSCQNLQKAICVLAVCSGEVVNFTGAHHDTFHNRTAQRYTTTKMQLYIPLSECFLFLPFFSHFETYCTSFKGLAQGYSTLFIFFFKAISRPVHPSALPRKAQSGHFQPFCWLPWLLLLLTLLRESPGNHYLLAAQATMATEWKPPLFRSSSRGGRKKRHCIDCNLACFPTEMHL